MTLKPEKERIACHGCLTGSVSVAERRKGVVFCPPCAENFKRIIRGARLQDANQKVPT